MMKKFLTLTLFLVALLSLTGCMLKSPTYDGATAIKMLDEDKEAFINNGALVYKATLFNHSEDFMWTTDEILDAQKTLDKSLPADKWRLVSDWSGDQHSKTSEWKNGDVGLIVVMYGNLDGTQISSYERRYGMSGIQPGATLIMMYNYDKNKPQPDRTATVQTKNIQSTKAAPTAAPTAAPKKK
jgi:hypothetical protein